MTKIPWRQEEVEATLDGKTKPLNPLERVLAKIQHFRSHANSGVTIRLSPEETDMLCHVLEWPNISDSPTIRHVWGYEAANGRTGCGRHGPLDEQFDREASRYGVRQGKGGN